MYSTASKLPRGRSPTVPVLTVTPGVSCATSRNRSASAALGSRQCNDRTAGLPR